MGRSPELRQPYKQEIKNVIYRKEQIWFMGNTGRYKRQMKSVIYKKAGVTNKKSIYMFRL